MYHRNPEVVARYVHVKRYRTILMFSKIIKLLTLHIPPPAEPANVMIIIRRTSTSQQNIKQYFTVT